MDFLRNYGSMIFKTLLVYFKCELLWTALMQGFPICEEEVARVSCSQIWGFVWPNATARSLVVDGLESFTFQKSGGVTSERPLPLRDWADGRHSSCHRGSCATFSWLKFQSMWDPKWKLLFFWFFFFFISLTPKYLKGWHILPCKATRWKDCCVIYLTLFYYKLKSSRYQYYDRNADFLLLHSGKILNSLHSSHGTWNFLETYSAHFLCVYVLLIGVNKVVTLVF